MFQVMKDDTFCRGQDKATKAKEKYNCVLHRVCRLFVHEALHLLQFNHCIYHQCCMNGSGHIKEDDSQPLTLCPVDTRKLCHLMQLDPIKYQDDVKTAAAKLTIQKYEEIITPFSSSSSSSSSSSAAAATADSKSFDTHNDSRALTGSMNLFSCANLINTPDETIQVPGTKKRKRLRGRQNRSTTDRTIVARKSEPHYIEISDSDSD